VLTNPIFFKKDDWIDVSNYMSREKIMRGKRFDTSESNGSALWQKIDDVLQRYLKPSLKETNVNELTLSDIEWPGYGKFVLQKVRVGQGAFRVLVTDAYNRKCSISGEKTLPVLEAAHIKPYNLEGPHLISNGLLLRSDIHKLFDSGYITITKEYKVEVSKAIKEEFENGREYYKYHGSNILYLPSSEVDKPKEEFIEWHNGIYKG
jgi:putative restriction endonuclease